MGHWVEMMKINTTAENLIRVANDYYGSEYACNMEQEMDGMSLSRKCSFVEKNAAVFV